MSDLYDKELFEKFDQNKPALRVSKNHMKLILLGVAAAVILAVVLFATLGGSGESIEVASSSDSNSVAKIEKGSSKRIDINQASEAELQKLPGIGPQTAKDIIKGRPYATIEEIMTVKGIGPKTFDGISGNISVK